MSGEAALPADKATKLCRAWDNRRRKDTAMKPEDLRALARAAGGEQRIPTFCAPLLRPYGNGPAAPSSPTTQPSPSHSASDDDDSDDSESNHQGDDEDEGEDD